MSEQHRYSIRSARLVLAVAILPLLLPACSSINSSSINPVNWITPYKVDVVQGNFISKEQVEVLRPGMTRAQVKDVLGTPLLTSVFHGNRWDYVFTLSRQGLEPQSLKYTVYFKGDLLERFEGDAMPSDAEFVSRLDSQRKLKAVPVLEASEEQLTRAAALRVTPAQSLATTPNTTPTSLLSYPPLESSAR